jgi:hypothetical protein
LRHECADPTAVRPVRGGGIVVSGSSTVFIAFSPLAVLFSIGSGVGSGRHRVAATGQPVPTQATHTSSITIPRDRRRVNHVHDRFYDFPKITP